MSKELISTPRQSPFVNILGDDEFTFHTTWILFSPWVYIFSITSEFTFRKECITLIFYLAVYKDYIIPKGTVLLATSLSMNMDPKLYHEPEKLKPGRFLNDNRSMYASSNGSTQNREVFTFGWGRRICPGIYMVIKRLMMRICV